MITIPDTTPIVMSVRKAEKVSGISKTKLYDWVAEGRLRACYVGKHMRITRDDLKALPRVGD